MFAGHAPPFGWYCSASRSRASAPSSSAIWVTSPVAPGWFVVSSPRCCASLKQRSEEHTSELQSRENLVCRILLETKNNFGYALLNQVGLAFLWSSVQPPTAE